MSANWFNYKFYFKTPQDQAKLAKILEGAEDNSIMARLNASQVLDSSREHIENFAVTEKYFLIALQTSTSCELNDELVLAMKPFGCEFVHVNVFYDQVGETEDMYLYRGQPVYDDELDALFDEFDVDASLEYILEKDDVSSLQKRLDEGLDPNSKIDDEPLLFSALYNDAKACMQLLVEKGADINSTDSNELPFLFRLFESDDKTQVPLALWLIDAGADINAKAYDGNSLLWEAWSYSEKIARHLAAKGAEYAHGEEAYQGAEDALDKLNVAIAHNDTQVIEQAIAELDEAQYFEVAEVACRYDRLGVIQALESRGFDLFSESEEGESLIETVSSYGSIAILNYLFEKAEDKTAFLETHSETIVDYFSQESEAKSLIQKVVDLGYDFEHNGPLNDALLADQFEIAQILVDGGCPLGDSEPDEEGDGSILHHLLDEASAEALQFLIDNGANTQYKNGAGQTIFERKNERGLKPGVKALLLSLADQMPAAFRVWNAIDTDNLEKFTQDWQALEDKNIVNENKENLLNVAVASRAFSIAAFLLENGYELETKSEMGNTPLSYAVILNQTEAVKWLLDKGANANALVCIPEKSEEEDDEDAEKLMSLMGLDGLNELAELEEKITEPVAIAENDSSSLMFACGCGNLEIAQQLLAAGADINFKDKDDSTALEMAVVNGHMAVTKYLVEQGADIHCGDGETLLHIACFRGNVEMAEYLSGLGLAINALNDENCTPLHCAITASTFTGIDIVDWALRAKADVNVIGDGRINPLILACQLSNAEAVSRLLDHDPDVNIVDRDGKTAFDYGVENKLDDEGIDLSRLEPTDSNIALKKQLALLRKFILWRVVPLAILYFIINFFSASAAKVIVGALAIWMTYRFIKKRVIPEKPSKMNKMFEHFASAMEKAGAVAEEQEKARKETRAKWDEAPDVVEQKVKLDWLDYLVKRNLLASTEEATDRLKAAALDVTRASFEEQIAAVMLDKRISFSRGQFDSDDKFQRLFEKLCEALSSFANCSISELVVAENSISVALKLNDQIHQIEAKRFNHDMPPGLISGVRKALQKQIQVDFIATDPMQEKVELVILPIVDIQRLKGFVS